MAKAKRDLQRERRIHQDIVVDAHDAEEQAMGWYYYLEEQLRLPFPGQCLSQRAISPLRPGQKVEVVDLAPAEECEHEMFVTVRWDEQKLAVPLAQLTALSKDKATRQAVADWHYWVNQGYQF
jgi:hypothetical protein